MQGHFHADGNTRPHSHREHPRLVQSFPLGREGLALPSLGFGYSLSAVVVVGTLKANACVTMQVCSTLSSCETFLRVKVYLSIGQMTCRYIPAFRCCKSLPGLCPLPASCPPPRAYATLNSKPYSLPPTTSKTPLPPHGNLFFSCFSLVHLKAAQRT